MVPQVYQSFVTSNQLILVQAPPRQVFLLRGHEVTRTQNFGKLGCLEGEFDYFLKISQDSRIFLNHCQVSASHKGSNLAQSENDSPRFSRCSIRWDFFRSLAALEVIFTFPRRAD